MSTRTKEPVMEFFFSSESAADAWVGILTKLYGAHRVTATVSPASDPDSLPWCVEVEVGHGYDLTNDEIHAVYLAWGEGYIHGKAEVISRVSEFL